MKILKSFGYVLTMFMAVSAAPHAYSADLTSNERLKQIITRGSVRVGVQGAIKPFSYRESSGAIVGIEPDIAAEIAKTIGVKLELVQIESSNRIQFLQQGKIDVLVGNMSDTPERRSVVGIINPNYWASGATVLSKKDTIKSWEALRGKPVCAVQGVFYAKSTQQSTGANILAFPGKVEAAAALRDGKCIAFLTDDSTAGGLLLSPEWSGYEIAIETRYTTPWGVATRLEDRDGALGVLVSGVLYRMISSGSMLELATKWKIAKPAWLISESDKLKYTQPAKMTP